MPIYEYECPLCGVFEVTQKVSDKPLKAKPDCGRSDCPKKAQRLISASAFHLKGSGWYKTDYASGSAATKKTPDKTDKSDSGTKDKGSTDTTKKTDSGSKPSGGGGGGCGPGCGCN